MIGRPTIVVAAALLVAGCDVATHRPGSTPSVRIGGLEPAGTNVLIVLIDDVGVDRVAVYGAAKPAVTPVLDGLAASGMVFDNAWSLPLCGPTRSALQTGLLPRRTGYGKNSSVGSDYPTELDPDFTTIAEMVADSPAFAYDTSYVGKWHLASIRSESGTLGPKVQGWKWWTGMMSSVLNWFGPNPTGESPSYFHFQRIDNDGAFLPTDGYATTVTADDAIGRLGTMSEPWMMQVAFNAAHEPLHVPPSSLIHTELSAEATNADLHRAMFEALDTELGRLLDAMSDDLRDRTTIFVLGDNGTPRPVAERDEDADHMKGSLYEGGIHVPFIVTGPLVAQPGTHSDALASVVDLFPTIAEIAGAPVDAPVDGVSLLPVLRDPSADVRTTTYAEKFTPGGGGPFESDQRAIRNDRFKLVLDPLCDTERLYEYLPGAADEGDDLLEAGPLTDEQKHAHADLRAELDEMAANLVYEADTWPDHDVVPLPCPP